jgi:hypothetical protein
MNEIIVQGRKLSQADILLINNLIRENPEYGRSKLSVLLCELWNWRTPYGQLKDIACRSMLVKLDAKGLIKLPAPIIIKKNTGKPKKTALLPHDTSPVEMSFSQLGPVSIKTIDKPKDFPLFKMYISKYHYLGLKSIVGENIKYMVFDRNNRPLACLLFGAAAWKVESRDNFIGWRHKEREKNLMFITNNSRFLIFPWVKVPHLASHLLAGTAKRISEDFYNKYKHPIHLLETFVQVNRNKGTCYKAANWIYVGLTKGRGKMDTFNQYAVPVKSVWLYPLTKKFKQILISG